MKLSSGDLWDGSQPTAVLLVGGLFGWIVGDYLVLAAFGQTNNLVGMAYTINLHAWGSSWHSWHGDPYQIVPLLEFSNLLSWHVTFNKLSVNHGCVAGG